MCLYEEMIHFTCTMISSVDLAHYGVPRAKDRVSVALARGLSTVEAHKPRLSPLYHDIQCRHCTLQSISR